MAPWCADKLKELAYRWGSDPAEWYGTFHPVERAKWIAVEELVDEGEWAGRDKNKIIVLTKRKQLQ
jgi:hypothetical protein